MIIPQYRLYDAHGDLAQRIEQLLNHLLYWGWLEGCHQRKQDTDDH